MTEFANFEEIKPGDIVTGTVVKVEDKQVLVDISYKTEGIVPLIELSNVQVENAHELVNEGDSLTLKVKKVADEEVILSKKAMDAEKAWDDIQEKFDNNVVFETTVKEIVKGGLVADVGLRGFIPASMVETHFVDDFSDYKGKTLSVKVIELDREKNRIILSHRAVVEEENEHKKGEVLQSLEPGQVIEGTVQRLTNFGAFVDIGGVDGLVHISQLAHEHVDKASDVVKEGDKVKVEVLSVDLDNERISLSRKAVLPGPWENIGDKIKKGDVVEGTVKRLADFGAFVEVFPGVEGLVHISEIANRHIAKPSEVLSTGQKVDVKVLDVNEAEGRISLSIKELEEPTATDHDYSDYEDDSDQGSFSLGDFIGDKLDKYK
ncbi:30S ribosomal protein S1 [Aciduricibacillus chroicocephali]|uniref:30S ribosomal protein S1 n=1 Tax=Aciduricibacillus chroicocephali TaxID=3054939 RepID=A0ABY9KRD7_9BACI|nr:30S ribosomal protein S1 [Bacillaceae bacterium 44XB]